ncbi:MAG: rhomboid family intramembrane serine protease [Eubacteriales bacterium]|nr:rhomboid family intramembrane serine protease [Eubacteriales bacterium]
MIAQRLVAAGYEVVHTDTAGVTVYCMDDGPTPHRILLIEEAVEQTVSLAAMLQQTHAELGGAILVIFDGEAVYRRLMNGRTDLQVPIGIYAPDRFLTNQEVVFQRLGVLAVLYANMGRAANGFARSADKEGAGGVRAGLRARTKRIFGQLGFLTVVLILANVITFFVTNGRGQFDDLSYLAEHGGMISPFLEYGTSWKTALTSMFLHADWLHLAYNMVSLYFIGNMLELRIGSFRFALVYLLGGLGGNVVSAAYYALRQQPVVSLGASGAVFALLGAYILIALLDRHRIKGSQLPYLLRLAVAAGLALSGGFTQSNIDNAAHIGGFAGGLLVTAVLFWLQKKRRDKSKYDKSK